MNQKHQSADSISEIYEFGKSLQRTIEVIKRGPRKLELVFEFFKAF